jgi:hypothetical protein
MVPALVIIAVGVAAMAGAPMRRWSRRGSDRAADRDFMRARAAMRAFDDATAAEPDADMVVIAAAYHLTRLLDLADVAWALQPGDDPCGTLRDDATIDVDGRPRGERGGAGPARFCRALIDGSRHFGWLVMTAEPGRGPIGVAALHASVTMCDGVAAALAMHAHPPIGDTDVGGRT